MEYEKSKFHGGLMYGSKCKYCWQNGEFCIHQISEMLIKKVPKEFIIKRDFKECEE